MANRERSDRSVRTDLPAVLFDLDGTLVDSNYHHVQAWGEALHASGIFIPRWKIHRRIGMSGTSFLQELLRELGASNRRIDLQRLERQHDAKFQRALAQIDALPGADKLLAHLARERVRMAIATTGNKQQTSRLLRKLDLPRRLVVVTGDDVEKAKPSPDIFMTAARNLGVSAGNCIVVGDSVWDLLAAGRGKALGVGLLSGGYGLEELQGAGAFRVFADPADLLLHIEQLGLPGTASALQPRGRR